MLFLDLFLLVEVVFLELFGLEWDLLVCLFVCSDGYWLLGLFMLCYFEILVEKYYGVYVNLRFYYLF